MTISNKWLRMEPTTIRATLSLSKKLVQMSVNGECLSRRLGLYKVLETPLRQQQELLALLFTCATSGRKSELANQAIATEEFALAKRTESYEVAAGQKKTAVVRQKKQDTFVRIISEARLTNVKKLDPVELFTTQK